MNRFAGGLLVRDRGVGVLCECPHLGPGAWPGGEQRQIRAA